MPLPVSRRIAIGGVRVVVTALAVGTLFGTVTAALALAAAWAIAGLLDLPAWFTAPLETFASLVGLAVGMLVAVQARHAELRLAEDAGMVRPGAD